MTTTLTSAQRVHRAMERKDQDRVPRYEHFWTDTIARWETEGLTGGQHAVLEKLGADFQSLCWSWPSPFPGQRKVIEETDTTIAILDQFGQSTREWKNRMGTPEHLGWACTDRDAWETDIKPRLLATSLHVDPEQVAKKDAQAKANGRFAYLAGAESFEMTRKLMGDEVTLIAMAVEPDWIADVSRVHTDLLIRDYQAVLDAGAKPDCIWMYGDMAFNHATMCSPAMYRDLIWPDHKRLADFAHANGMKFIYHTDGNVNGVMDLYLEAGFDCLQPLEVKAGMDIRKLIPTYGQRMSFFGNVDVMVMATNDLEKIEAEVAAKINAGKQTNGYLYHSDHSVPPSVAWRTYQRIIEFVDKYGQY